MASAPRMPPPFPGRAACAGARGQEVPECVLRTRWLHCGGFLLKTPSFPSHLACPSLQSEEEKQLGASLLPTLFKNPWSLCFSCWVSLEPMGGGAGRGMALSARAQQGPRAARLQGTVREPRGGAGGTGGGPAHVARGLGALSPCSRERCPWFSHLETSLLFS